MAEYFYQVKDNIKTEKQISIIKGKEKNFEEKRKQIIHKRRLFEWTLLFSPAFKKIQYERIPNEKEKYIVRISCLATLQSIF